MQLSVNMLEYLIQYFPKMICFKNFKLNPEMKSNQL